MFRGMPTELRTALLRQMVA
ncbi:hypothetical protein Golob_000252 [Gossypium lobatum]|uniref:Uncharacterized protein n=1 Tax=Gossypium lobatum TaxID=34289 RepID=A0A7J8N7Y2_9ROSI|nr:hypothetical protein [Gossypium lobatum]